MNSDRLRLNETKPEYPVELAIGELQDKEVWPFVTVEMLEDVWHYARQHPKCLGANGQPLDDCLSWFVAGAVTGLSPELIPFGLPTSSTGRTDPMCQEAWEEGWKFGQGELRDREWSLMSDEEKDRDSENSRDYGDYLLDKLEELEEHYLDYPDHEPPSYLTSGIGLVRAATTIDDLIASEDRE